MSVHVRDENGSPVPGVLVGFAVEVGGGVLSRYTALSDDQGVARTSWRLGERPGEHVIRASVAGADPVAHAIAVEEGETVGLEGGNDQDGAAGELLPDPLEVRVVDAFGQPVEGREVGWEVTAGRGSVSAATTTTNADGVASVLWRLGTQPGVNTLQARVGFGIVRFTAQGNPGPPALVRVSPSVSTIKVGDVQHFAATALDRYGNPVQVQGFSLFSSAPSIAAVTGPDRVQGVTIGTATIRASVRGATGTAQINVIPVSGTVPENVSSLQVVQVTATTATLRLTQVDDGEGGAAHYEVRHARPPLDWASASGTGRDVPGTAVGAPLEFTVDGLEPNTAYEFQVQPFNAASGARGSLSNIAEGITADPAGPTVTSLVVTPTHSDLTSLGQQVTLSVTALDAGGAPVPGVSFSYTSLDPLVAQVGPTGIVTAQGVGSTSIEVTAVCCAVSETVTVQVRQVPQTLTVSTTSVTMTPGQERQLTAVVRDARGNPIGGQSITWAIGNTSVATISTTGLLRAVSPGTTTVTVRSGTLGASVAVAVNAAGRGAWLETIWDFPDIDAVDASATFNVTSDRPVVQLVRDAPALPWAGSNYVRINFVADGGASQTAGIRVFPPLADTEKPRELWVEVWVRFSEDFMVARGGDHKTMFLLESGRTDGTRNRWELKIGAFGLDIVGQIKNGNVHTETSCIPPVGAEGTAAGECPFRSPTRPDLDTFVWDGSWHRLRWHAKMASGPGAEDGVYEAWLDGTKFLESLGIATDAQSGAWFDDIALGRNLDQPLPAPQTLDWGQLRVYTQDPGW